MTHAVPFSRFSAPWRSPTPLRQAITDATRRSEAETLAPLLVDATLDAALAERITATATDLVQKLRAGGRRGGVESLVHEFALSSAEGVALMCLAEALLRIPDAKTRDALIRDKLATGDWAEHLGGHKSLFVNAATWGLVVTGKLVSGVDEPGLTGALTRVGARLGEPVIRLAMDTAMRMMGEQFVAGETIDDALSHARKLERQGFRYSYDMLGEAAVTAHDAQRYYADYENAIHAIGRAAQDANGNTSVYERPGISVKLSALHPRYSRAQLHRVRYELFPRVLRLAALAREYNIGFNIDAEEQDRLELSLDILENLAHAPELADWGGLGFVVQAYGRRCRPVLDWIIDLARQTRRRIMVRLVKGAYWDAEIKRAQVDGLSDFPVYTRKHHTDIAYIANARTLLDAPDAVFPQFATHNARTLATIYEIAGHMQRGGAFSADQYEFQCLHGMGEALYENVVGPDKLDRPCRIYAPVGTHETLLAYLVRRLLENGANSSFVNKIWDSAVPVSELVEDPVALALAEGHPGEPHSRILPPGRLFPDRRNSAGIDLSDENTLARLGADLSHAARSNWRAAPRNGRAESVEVRNPSDRRDLVGIAFVVSPDAVPAAVARAAASGWEQTDVAARAAMLDAAADAMQDNMNPLLALLVREAGKSLPNAIAEVREAIDFIRYYSGQARATLAQGARPLGPVACISPWNFPLAIFTGQVVAALAAGNPVLAKPAEETPLIAAEAVRLLHAAGVPADALQLLPGDGEVGAALVDHAGIAGVVFTGSTEVAALIRTALADRVGTRGKPIPLVAETGGQNAMIVDSSALAEQVVADVLASAFDSAGQRCSALRVLCLQEEIADRTLEMLTGAMRELRIGSPDALSIDVGPVISAEARQIIERHVAAMRSAGCKVLRLDLPEDTRHGFFAAPTIIEIDGIERLTREVFGPVLHVVRYKRSEIGQLIAAINATGYALTFGLHTRLDNVVEDVCGLIDAGNIYVNRNMVGATVGSQPFGGRGLSGTGPKAGGPMYLERLIDRDPAAALPVEVEGKSVGDGTGALQDFARWLDDHGHGAAAASARGYAARSRHQKETDLPGPTGERNLYLLKPRGTLLLQPATLDGLFDQIAVTLATGNRAVCRSPLFPANLPSGVRERIATDPVAADVDAVLIEGDAERVIETTQAVAAWPGPIVPVFAACDGEFGAYPTELLLDETVICTNTTAAGGNASLMMLD